METGIGNLISLKYFSIGVCPYDNELSFWLSILEALSFWWFVMDTLRVKFCDKP